MVLIINEKILKIHMIWYNILHNNFSEETMVFLTKDQIKNYVLRIVRGYIECDHKKYC